MLRDATALDCCAYLGRVAGGGERVRQHAGQRRPERAAQRVRLCAAPLLPHGRAAAQAQAAYWVAKVSDMTWWQCDCPAMAHALRAWEA